jgi:glycosyltransferase involved in cell wall biosynthesis
MISVILPTRNDEVALAYALAALVPAAAEGFVREAIIADGGSDDGSLEVADAAGCRFYRGSGRLGEDLAAAAAIARSEWLLFLSPRTALEPAWQREAGDFIERVAMSPGGERAAVFRHARSEYGMGARLAEGLAALRTRLFAAPYLEEGLLISAALYRELGGHRPLPGMVEADLARRIGRRRLVFLRSRAILRADASRPGGAARGLRNTCCLALFVLRVPTGWIGRLAA